MRHKEICKINCVIEIEKYTKVKVKRLQDSPFSIRKILTVHTNIPHQSMDQQYNDTYPQREQFQGAPFICGPQIKDFTFQNFIFSDEMKFSRGLMSSYNYKNKAPSMKVELPVIVWHGSKERILSIDFHPFNNEFVTGGSDEFNPKEVGEEDGYAKIWEVTPGQAELVTFRYGLQAHQSNINAVKFSPDGRYLATGSDDKMIIIWEIRENFVSTSSSQKVKKWSCKYQLSGHMAQVLDLKWSANSKYLISAGVDKRIIVWHVEKSRYERILEEHSRFVQGVAVDPKFKYIISQSNDRTVKIWKNAKTKKNDVAFYSFKTLKKMDFVKENKEKKDKQNQQDDKSEQNVAGFKMFYDDTITTFFRRPDISPDGQLFLLPAGQWQRTPQSTPQHCAFLYRRKFLEKPSFFIETKGQPSVCARFCPKLFAKSNPDKGLFRQAYYMVFAISTLNSVLVYNTDNLSPVYAVGNYHYAGITQLSWKGQGILGMSSSDGFCSFMLFEKDELGVQYEITEDKLKGIVKRDKYEAPAKDEKMQVQTSEARVIIRQTENHEIKKTIVPKMITKF